MKTKNIPFLLSPIFYHLSPITLSACPVCFGKTDNVNLVKAFTWGVALMLGFTFLILGILSFVIYKNRGDQRTS